jgi:hypothetical protein
VDRVHSGRRAQVHGGPVVTRTWGVAALHRLVARGRSGSPVLAGGG